MNIMYWIKRLYGKLLLNCLMQLFRMFATVMEKGESFTVVISAVSKDNPASVSYMDGDKLAEDLSQHIPESTEVE